MHIVLGAFRRGQVLLATVNEQTMVPFVSQQLNNLDLALSLAKRGNLPGAEALVGQNFERLFANGQFKEAAEAAAESPQASSLAPPKNSIYELHPRICILVVMIRDSLLMSWLWRRVCCAQRRPLTASSRLRQHPGRHRRCWCTLAPC